MPQELNYEALISCYGGAVARFEFYAENGKLAQDHIIHILNSEETIGLGWSSIPSQFHYIQWKKKSNKTSKYNYTTKPFDGAKHKQWEMFSKKAPLWIPDMLSIIKKLADVKYAGIGEDEAEGLLIAMSNEADNLLNKLNTTT